MRIGILGAGSIGGTLTRRLSQTGHDVKVANSRGPHAIDPDLLTFGATAVDSAGAIVDADAVVCSIPFLAMSHLVPLISQLPPGAVVIDTSNYYPTRDGRVGAVDDGKVESQWVSELFGRPIAKAWNAISAESFAGLNTSRGALERIAVPVAADRDRDREVVMQLVDESGFDAFYTGSIADSWRIQVGAPAYCTDLTREQMAEAVASAQKDRLPKRRDLAMAVIAERTDGFTGKGPDFGEWLVRLNRVLYM